MKSDTKFIDSSLKESIAETVHEFAQQKELEGIKSLSRYNPQKVGLILYLFSQGVSQSQMVKKYHLSHQTIKHTIIEYADHAGEWAKLGAKISKTFFLDLSSLEEDMVERIRERLFSGELLPTFNDLLYVSTAFDKAWKQADRARDRCETVPETPGVTHEQYQATVVAVKKRMEALKRLEAVAT